MTPKTYFDEVWQRCELISALHSYISSHTTSALQPDELLRAEWASRVSALDLYMHELVAQNLLKVFAGQRKQCPGFTKLSISADALMRISNANTLADQMQAFDLEVRTKLSRITYQDPEQIADGIRLISKLKIWEEVALKQNPATKTVKDDAQRIKRQLSLIVQRRNKIVHEADLQPVFPRKPWAISKTDVAEVSAFIHRLVTDINETLTSEDHASPE